MTQKEFNDFRRGSVKCFCTFCSIFILLCSWATLAEAQGVDLTVSITDVPDGTQNSAFSVTITFSEAVSGFEKSDIDITALATVTIDSADDTVYTAEITPNDGAAGDVIFSVPENVAKPAAAAPGTPDNNTASQEHTVNVDLKPPTVKITNLPTLEKEAFDITIEFDEPVDGFDASDITLGGSASATASLESGSDGDAEYEVRITPSSSGNLTIEVDEGAAADALENTSAASPQVSVTVDQDAPTVTISNPPTGSQKDPFTVDIDFSENVTGLASNDITLSPSGLASVAVSGSDASYTAEITPTDGQQGDVAIQVVANVAEDAVGNGNDASDSITVAVDKKKPTITLSGIPNSPQKDPFDVTITFSENVTGLAPNDITLSPSGLASVAVSGSDASYTATITPTDGQQGDVDIQVVADTVTDDAGNNNETSGSQTVHIDAKPPTVRSIDVPENEKNEAFDITLTFSEPVKNLGNSDVELLFSNGDDAVATVTALTEDSSTTVTIGGDAYTSTYTATITPNPGKEGDVTLQVVAGAVVDAAGNGNTTFTAADSAVHIDTIPPTVVSIDVPEPEKEKNEAFEVTITFSEDVAEFDNTDIIVTGGASATGTSGSGNIYTATITPNPGEEDDITLQVKAEVVTDNAGNENTDPSAETPPIHIDTIPPTVESIDVPENEKNEAFDITLTFSEPVKNLGNSDIELLFSNGNNAVATVTALAEDSSTTVTIGGDDYTSTYTATITPNPGKEGDVTLQVVAGAVVDAAGNGNTTFTATDSVVHVDTIPPTVSISGLPDGEQNGAFDITITFSEPVNSFEVPADLTVTGPASASWKSGDDGDTVYTVTITPNPEEEDDVTLQVKAEVVTDNAGNGNTESAETPPIHIDTIAPEVESIGLPTGEQNGAFEVTITFSEDVTDFDKDDLAVSGEATATGTSGSGKDYTATITPNPGKEDDITLQVEAGGVTDTAGNKNTASAVTPQIHIDTIPPTVSISGLPDGEQKDAFDITLTFSEPVKDFEASDIELLFSNGDDAVATVTKLTEDSSTTVTIGGDDYTPTYTVEITPNAGKESDVTLQVVASAVTDVTGNANTAFTATDSVHIDTIDPEVSISDIPDIEKNVPFDLTVTFTEEVNGFQVPADLTVTGPADASLKSGDAGDTVYVVTITPTDGKEGDVTVQVKASAVQDAAQNDNTASNVADVHIDTIVPVVDAITGIPDIEKNIAFDITITFSEEVNGFQASGLTVTGPANASLKSGGDGDTVYIVTITPDDAQEGDVTVQVPAGAVRDFALSDNTISEVTDSVHIDTIPPEVSINGIPDIEKNAAFDLTITFSEAVNGFEVPADLTVTGPADASLKSGDAGDAVYIVTITPDDAQEGDVTVQVKASAVQDAALNANTDASAVTPSVHVDTIAPTVAISGTPTTEQKDAFDLTITFSEAVNGFEVPADLTVTGPASAEDLRGGVVNSDGEAVYTVTITPDDVQEGDVTVQVKAGAVQDAALNANTDASAVTPSVHVDTIAPTVAISGTPTTEQKDAFDLTITFSEAVNGFEVPADLTVTGPVSAEDLREGVINSDGEAVYTVTITPDDAQEGDVTVQVKAGAVQDAALNANTDASEVTDSVHVDTIAPTVEIGGAPDIEKNVAFDLTITFSEEVNGFEVPADLTVTGPASAGGLTAGIVNSDGEAVYTVTITPADAQEGDVTVQVKASAVQDLALNANTDASAVTDSVHVDTIPPTVEITDIPTEIQLEAFSVTIIFSEVVSEFEVEDIQITGEAVVDNVTLIGSGNVYILDILPNDNTDGDVILKVPEGVAKDEATNVNTPSPLQTVFVAPKWIPDPNLRTVVREELGLEEGEDFAPEQLEELTAFDGFYREINDLTGLEYATELTSAELTGNFIGDLTPLADLTTLTTLILDNNIVRDIAPLEALTSLTTLNLARNLIDDITPLENLTVLTTLNLSENFISDLNPLAGLAALTHLYLTGNDIRDVSPIVHLENLDVLEILENPIRNSDLLAGIAKAVKTGNTVPSVIPDKVLAAAIRRALKLEASTPITITQLKRITTLQAVPVTSSTISSLAGLEHATALTALVLSGHAITDLSPLSGLTGLTLLDLNGNNISDLTPIAALTRLSTLQLRDNSLSDVDPLSDLTALTSLDLSGNNISDLTPIAALTRLSTLQLRDNSLSDLSPLSDLTALRTLDLNGNRISVLRALSDLEGLETLGLGENAISDLSPLSDLTALTSLELSGNRISVLTALSDLEDLETLGLGENAISNLNPLSDLIGLRTLNLMGNTISNLSPLSALTGLTTLVLEGNAISNLAPLQMLTQLRLLNLNSNSIVDIRSLAALTQTRRLELIANNISDVQPLAGLLNLSILRLVENPILDTTPLYPLTRRVPPVDIDIAVVQYPAWDVNKDGSVNAVDSALVTVALGQSGDAIVNPRTDVNNDDTVDNADLLLVTENLEDSDAGAPSVASLLAGLGAPDKATLAAELKRLIAESDGSLKYRRAIAFLESLLGVLSPHETLLLANYPNPFNPETWIPYHLAKSSDVRITIYDVRGSVVRRLELGHLPPGYYTSRNRAAYWDGRNNMGERVASGVYFYQLQADNISLLRKMVILK